MLEFHSLCWAFADGEAIADEIVLCPESEVVEKWGGFV